MTTLLGFILFCCVAWWWVRGRAFAAFCLALLWALANLFQQPTLAPLYSTRALVGYAVIALPWLIRSQILWSRSKRIAWAGEQVWRQPTGYPRIPR